MSRVQIPSMRLLPSYLLLIGTILPHMRKYQPIWEQLKTAHIVSLTAETSSHSRILCAVRKEKFKDLGWKLICSETGNSYKLVSEIEGEEITFTLIPYSSTRNL